MSIFCLAADMFKMYSEFRLTDFSSFLMFVFALCGKLPLLFNFYFLLLKFFSSSIS